MSQFDLESLPPGASVEGWLDDMQPEVGGWLGDAWKGVKKVVKSPITKVIVGGVAIVFPPVGVPAAAALVAADQVVRASESSDPKVAAKAKATIAATTKLANAGDAHAQAALKIMVVAKSGKGIVSTMPGSMLPSKTTAKTLPKPMAAPVARAAPKPFNAAAAAASAGAARSAALSKAAGWIRSTEGQYKRAS